MTINNIDSMLEQASSALDSGDLQAAAGLYENILKQASDNQEACLMLGSLYGESGRLPEAVELLKKALELKPEDAAAALVLARVYMATGDAGKAVDVLEQVSQSVEDAEVTYTLGTLKEAAGERERASELFGRAIEQAPGDPRAWLAMASFRMNAGEFDAAEAAYNEVLKREPGNSSAVGFLSVLLSEQERMDEAESLLRDALTAHGDNPELHFYLAHTLKQQGMNAEAIESCEQALMLAPEERRYITKKAEILEGMGDLEQAFTLLKPILESGNIPVDAALVFVRLSHPLGMTGDARVILQGLSRQPLMPLQRQNVQDALQWLESV